MKTDAAFTGAARIIVLDTKALKDFDTAVIHAHRDTEVELTQRPAQYLTHLRVQFEQFCHMIELALSHFKRIGGFCHCFFLLLIGSLGWFVASLKNKRAQRHCARSRLGLELLLAAHRFN